MLSLMYKYLIRGFKMFKTDLKIRITIINDLEKEVLQEPNRVLRRKKLSELMSARHNLRLQFYNDSIQDATIQNMLSDEATTFIKFQEKLLTQFGCSNAEFGSCLNKIILHLITKTQIIYI